MGEVIHEFSSFGGIRLVSKKTDTHTTKHKMLKEIGCASKLGRDISKRIKYSMGFPKSMNSHWANQYQKSYHYPDLYGHYGGEHAIKPTNRQVGWFTGNICYHFSDIISDRLLGIGDRPGLEGYSYTEKPEIENSIQWQSLNYDSRYDVTNDCENYWAETNWKKYHKKGFFIPEVRNPESTFPSYPDDDEPDRVMRSSAAYFVDKSNTGKPGDHLFTRTLLNSCINKSPESKGTPWVLMPPGSWRRYMTDMYMYYSFFTEKKFSYLSSANELAEWVDIMGKVPFNSNTLPNHLRNHLFDE